MNQIIIADAVTGLKQIESGTVDTCVTSPPYYGLRDYGVSGQIGLEETPEQYIARLVEVFREVKRVLRDDGTLWVNIADSYNGTGGGQKANKGNQGSLGLKATDVPGVKHKDLIGIPWMLAFALRSDGWYLRQDIIWAKGNPMPESVTDRCTKSHEYMFLLSKSAKYYYDYEAVKEPIAASTIGRGAVSFGGAKGRAYKPEESDPNYRAGSEQWGRTYDYAESNKDGLRNKRDVWHINAKPYKGAHFATFPPELIRPCIKAGSRPNGIVLDPFAGSGTTAQVSIEEGRQYIAIELNESYKALIQERIDRVSILQKAVNI